MTESSRSLNSFRNFISSLVKAFSTSIVGFIVTPFVIGYIGHESYGVFKLIIDWVSNVWIFDLGVSSSFLAIAAIYHKKSNQEELYGDGFKLHLKALPVLFIASTAIYFILYNLVDFSKISKFEYTVGFWIIAIVFISYPFNVFRQYFEVSERTSLVNIVTIAQLFLINIFTWFFAYMGFGLVGVCFAFAFFTILGYLYIYYLVKKETGWSFKKLLASKNNYSGQIKKTSLSHLLISISQKISFLGDNTIIAYFYSPAQVVPFFISQRLASLFQGQIQGLTYSGWASLIDFFNNDEKEIFVKRFKEFVKFNTVLAFVAVIITWSLNEKFVKLWIGEEYYISDKFNYIVSALMLVNILNFMLGHIFSGTGYVKKQSKAYLILGISNLLLSIALTKAIGFTGPVLASLITLSILLFYKLLLIKKIYSVGLIELGFIFIPQLVMTTFTIYFYEFLYKEVELTWFTLVLHIISLTLIYTLLSFIFTFNSEEKSTWTYRLKKIVSSYLK